jgi:hypothetical protein
MALALYDLPATFRAIWTNDVTAMANATALKTLPFGNLRKNVFTLYENPLMATEPIAGIPLHRVDNFFTKQKKQRIVEDTLI